MTFYNIYEMYSITTKSIFQRFIREEAIEYNFKSKQGCGVTVHSFIAVCVRKHVSF